jgi:hypothetical protein
MIQSQTSSGIDRGATLASAIPVDLPRHRFDGLDARREWRAVAWLVIWGAAVRILAIVAIHFATHGQEINDDFPLYNKMIENPLILITGKGVEALQDGGIYAPLVPAQLWFPGSIFSRWVGPVTGRRLGMLVYDLVALAVTLRVAFRVAGRPRTASQWVVALFLAVLPVSVVATSIWGQEDTAAALWSAAALATFVWFGPLPAMLIAGAGLFTAKLFFVFLMFGIWLADGARTTRVALTGVGCVAAFALFLLLRWLASGFLYPDYHYNAISNSPSVWALYYLLIKPLEFDDPIRPYIKIVAAVGMVGLAMAAWVARDRRLPVWSTVVAAHCVFFASFIGVHPEHYQWFLPFLIVFAWVALQRRRWLAFSLSILITYLGYAYKVVYGLRGPPGPAGSGKQVIRDVFERLIGINLYWFQLALIFITLGTLLLLAREALRMELAAAETGSAPNAGTPG